MRGGKSYIFAAVRKQYLVLQPEEMVRQLVLLYLNQALNYPKNRIRVEMGLEVNRLKKRCDILVFDPDFKPWLLVECKAPKVTIDQKTFEQIAQYNLKLSVPYLLVVNGPVHYICKIDHQQKTFDFLHKLPLYGSKG